MKKVKVIFAWGVLAIALSFQGCQKSETGLVSETDNIMPERFKVDIPNSISSAYAYKDSNTDTLQGNDVYEHLRTFIYVGEHAADMVGEIMLVIGWHNLSQPMSFTFTSNDDGRLKHVNIIEDVDFEGRNWQYRMTIIDQGTGGDVQENTAMQVFWDKNPIRGIALLNPYNIDRTTDPSYAATMYRIDYSEAGEMGYAHHMIVTIDNLPLAEPLTNPYAMSTLKMFVGKNGDVVSVYGNSEHPNATFFTGETGFDWAFVAAGKNSSDIGVAEVGLPSNTLNSASRHVLLVENSIQQVFEENIYEAWPWISPEIVQAYLYNAEAPGFFAPGGFVQGGTAPTPAYNSLLNIIAGLTPYNPWQIHTLDLQFD